MQLEYVPLLQTQRDLLDTPRGMERFQRYIDMIQPDGDNPLMPLITMNPMSREHVAARLDQLITLGSDDVAAAATVEAAQQLAHVSAQFKVGLVLADDVQGGWTNRYLSEAQVLFNYLTPPHKRATPTAARRGWVVVLLWVSDEPTPPQVRTAVRAAIFRTAYVDRYGFPASLRYMLAQEGCAAVFAEAPSPSMDHEELAYSRDAIRPLLDTTDFPTAFACLYGDEAARAVGYPAQGLSSRAGFALACTVAQMYCERTQQPIESVLDQTDDVVALSGMFDQA